MERNEIIEKLFSMKDAKYLEFHKKLVPGQENLIGIRVPALRAYAKELVKSGKAEAVMDGCKYEFYEETMLSGFLLGGIKYNTFEDFKVRLDRFAGHIDNWAVCDCTASSLKGQLKAYKKDMFGYFMGLLSSSAPYKIRFGTVCLMDMFTDDEHIDAVLQAYRGIKSGHYYVNMGLSWALSLCLIKYYTKTVPFFETPVFEKWVHNKAIQKATESFRISDVTKSYLRGLKIK